MRVVVVAAVFAGCADPIGPAASGSTSEGGQSGSDPGVATCEAGVTVGAADDVVAGLEGDFSAGDVLGVAEGAFDAALTWDDGAGAALVVEAAWDGEIRLFEPYEEVGVDGPCGAWIEVDGSYTFTTDDGAFAEAGVVTLHASGPTGGWFRDDWEEGELQGAWAFPDAEGTGTLHLFAELGALGVSGDVSLTTRTEGTGGVVGSSDGPPVATFAPAG